MENLKSSEEKFAEVIKKIEDYTNTENFQSIKSFEGVQSFETNESAIGLHTIEATSGRHLDNKIQIELYLLSDGQISFESFSFFKGIWSPSKVPTKKQQQLIDYAESIIYGS
jgi:hypothetical protein